MVVREPKSFGIWQYRAKPITEGVTTIESTEWLLEASRVGLFGPKRVGVTKFSHTRYSLPRRKRRISDNHSIAYCLMGYLCAYYRYYYPLEFITSFLNNAANEEDVRTGSEYAGRIGIKVTMPKWGISRGNYSFDRDKNTIAKGLSSIKYLGDKLAEELYSISHQKSHKYFVDVLYDLDESSSIDTRQLEILIKIDFFSEFGNQRELLYIKDLFYELFKKGFAKKVSRNYIDGTTLEPIVKKYAVGVTKSGGEAKSYTLLDVRSMLQECEEAVKAIGMPDLEDAVKAKNFADVAGYVGYISGKEEDNRKLYIMDVHPLKRKSDGKQFGYSLITKSIGSGKEARLSAMNRVFDECPVKKGDVIDCKGFVREGQYFRLTRYEKIA